MPTVPPSSPKPAPHATARGRDSQDLMLRVSQLLLSQLEPEALFETISTALWEELHHDFLALTIFREDEGLECFQLLDTPPFRGRYKIGQDLPVFMRLERADIRRNHLEILGPEQIAALTPARVTKLLVREGIQSMCLIPLISKGKHLGILSLGSREARFFGPGCTGLLERVTPLVALALDNALAFAEIRSLRDRLAEEKSYLEQETRAAFATDEIIGDSPALRKALAQAQTVATSDATVLLLGETGTGKELVARAIHERSRRRTHTFVKLNCSAIPMGLIESELFGHERGAFTGAIARSTGRMELAHQGTLFLDEVGDLPLEVQPKFLRAIQEREFERLGSSRTQRVDVRLIAATHRDLDAMVAEGTFRSDLFYRLKVFPIRIPPLRERPEDIPVLVRYFTQKFAQSMDKRIERVPPAAMAALTAWPWPGNIRELQNLVERSVILSPGPELQVPLAELKGSPRRPRTESASTLDDLEREGIRAALAACGGVVGGPRGAAARLGLKRTTLHSKMRRLGIVSPR